MMGRPTKPMETLEMQGTNRNDRHEKRAVEPQSGGRPEKPEWLTGEAASFWDEIIGRLENMKVLQSIDTSELVGMCRWWAVWRRLDEQLEELPDGADAYKLIIQAGLAWKNFDKIASRFGFTPVDRTRLGKPKETPKSKLMDLLKKRENLN